MIGKSTSRDRKRPESFLVTYLSYQPKRDLTTMRWIPATKLHHLYDKSNSVLFFHSLSHGNLAHAFKYSGIKRRIKEPD